LEIAFAAVIWVGRKSETTSVGPIFEILRHKDQKRQNHRDMSPKLKNNPQESAKNRCKNPVLCTVSGVKSQFSCHMSDFPGNPRKSAKN